jgi:predicted HTH transcriptional regulator
MYSNQDLIDLVDVFRTENGSENEWLEFKSNYLTNEEIGKYISALSNGAVLRGKPFAYLIFGVDDKTHEVIGTTFDYRKTKQGNEDLENWLKRLVESTLLLAFMR